MLHWCKPKRANHEGFALFVVADQTWAYICAVDHESITVVHAEAAVAMKHYGDSL